MKIIIFTLKSWNITNANKFKQNYPYHDIKISDTIDIKYIHNFNPDIIFFPHWSTKIPQEIYQKYVCIVFHMTDLPFGRGGSPLQNLIIRGIKNTKISAIKVTENMDAGDVYCKFPLDISTGNADNILTNASDIIFTKMIPYIVESHPTPLPQQGDVILFKRRTPSQSSITDVNFENIYDYIRMLDGEGYPPAYIDTEKLHITFRSTRKENNKVTGIFEIYDKQ